MILATFADATFPADELRVTLRGVRHGAGPLGVEFLLGKGPAITLDTHTAWQLISFLNAAVTMAERENRK